MNKRVYILLSASCLLALAGCVSRDDADAMLVRGCRAGVQSLLSEEMKIEKITGHEASKSPEGNDMRYIKLHTTTADGLMEEDKDYECIFEEQFGMFNMDYTASVYQVRTGDATYGRSGNTIMGDATDFLKLTDAIRKAMYSNTADDSGGAPAGGGN